MDWQEVEILQARAKKAQRWLKVTVFGWILSVALLVVGWVLTMAMLSTGLTLFSSVSGLP